MNTRTRAPALLIAFAVVLAVGLLCAAAAWGTAQRDDCPSPQNPAPCQTGDPSTSPDPSTSDDPSASEEPTPPTTKTVTAFPPTPPPVTTTATVPGPTITATVPGPTTTVTAPATPAPGVTVTAPAVSTPRAPTQEEIAGYVAAHPTAPALPLQANVTNPFLTVPTPTAASTKNPTLPAAPVIAGRITLTPSPAPTIDRAQADALLPVKIMIGVLFAGFLALVTPRAVRWLGRLLAHLRQAKEAAAPTVTTTTDTAVMPTTKENDRAPEGEDDDEARRAHRARRDGTEGE